VYLVDVASDPFHLKQGPLAGGFLFSGLNLSSLSFTEFKSKIMRALSAENLLQARELAEQFMLHFPDKPEPYYFSGLHLLLNQENKKAAGQLEIALGFNDKNINVLLNLGVAYQRLGEIDAANQAYLAVLAFEPDHVQALINLGSCHYQEKSFLECKQAFAKAASLAPNNSTVISGLADSERSLGAYSGPS
jgi:tetratricopeptide (TPR) repeat protein